MFMNPYLNPKVAALVRRLQSGLEAIQEHAVSVPYVSWPEPLHAGGWGVFGLKWQGDIVCDRWGWLHDPLVLNAGYSLLEPGTVIVPHVGYTADVLRLHVGLDCPESGCSITVGGITREWRNGEAMLFDDTIEHSARNESDKSRLILLVDLVRAEMQI